MLNAWHVLNLEPSASVQSDGSPMEASMSTESIDMHVSIKKERERDRERETETEREGENKTTRRGC